MFSFLRRWKAVVQREISGNGSREYNGESRIPEDIMDQPTQRLHIFLIFLFIQGYKIVDLVKSTTNSDLLTLPLVLNDSINWLLLKWLLLDFITVWSVRELRIERLRFSKFQFLGLLLVLGSIDYVLLGNYKLSSLLFLIPSSIKSITRRHISTDERSVRISSVLEPREPHLMGRVDVHLLALPTAHLNPHSKQYCIPYDSSSSTTILIPLVLNNTIPSRITYNLTNLKNPDDIQSITIPASALIKRNPTKSLTSSTSSSKSKSNDLNSNSNDSNDWSLILPFASSLHSSNLIHHADNYLPSSSSSSNSQTNLDSISVYHLPISSVGIVSIDSIYDENGRKIKIKRTRSTLSSSISASSNSIALNQDWEGVRISVCPRAGFETLESESSHPNTVSDGIHKCLDQSKFESVDLGLRVIGEEPLEIKWHRFDPNSSHRWKEETLSGITRPRNYAVVEAEDEIIDVPFNISISDLGIGKHQFFIDSVKDKYGNKIEFDHDQSTKPKSTSSNSINSKNNKKKIFSSTSSTSFLDSPFFFDTRSITVHPTPQLNFVGLCGKGESVKLSNERGKKANLELKSSIEEEWNGIVKHTSDSTGEINVISLSSKKEMFRFEVEDTGIYELVSVKGQFCEGIILDPSICTVYSPSIPALQSTFKPIFNECQSEIGTTVDLVLTGSPPFQVSYSLSLISSQSNSNKKQRKVMARKNLKINQSRFSFEIKPDFPGNWEYRIESIEDSSFGKYNLFSDDENSSEFVMNQVIHVEGSAEWKDVDRIRKVFSCESDSVEVEVVLKGQAPFEIEYFSIDEPNKIQTISNIQSNSHRFNIPIPSSSNHTQNLSAISNTKRSISLLSLKDGNNCKKILKGKDLRIEVKRSRPTARFVGSRHDRNILVKEGEAVNIPLSLSGDGPWTIEYSSPSLSTSSKSQLFQTNTFKSSHSTTYLELSQPILAGNYKLLSVKDNHCQGEVIEKDSEFNISFLSRPHLSLKAAGEVGKLLKNGNIIRQGVCVGKADKIGLRFEGKAPYTGSYTVSKSGSKESIHTFQSIQSESEFSLSTEQSGHYIYTFNGVADSIYTVVNHDGIISPSTKGKVKDNSIRIEQDVFEIPSASFISNKPRKPFCVNDRLESRHKDDLVVELKGKAPFEIEFEVRREEGQLEVSKFTISDIKSQTYSINLPFTFSNPSSYSILILRVSDSNGCERISDSSSSDALLPLEVAEKASITALSPQIDHCVGDFLEFGLTGLPPFLINYEFNSEKHSVPINTRKFSRLATSPGIFKINSIGSGVENQCKSEESLDLIKIVHQIPSARVSDGNLVVVDLNEGDQTEILFTFEGEPPFTFSFSRRHAQDQSNDKSILESHTVSGIMEYSYSIFTSQEGTWTVSYISDRFCSYPRGTLPSTSDIKMITSS